MIGKWCVVCGNAVGQRKMRTVGHQPVHDGACVQMGRWAMRKKSITRELQRIMNEENRSSEHLRQLSKWYSKP